MKRSNIFTLIELSKFIESVHSKSSPCCSELQALHSYFNIIPANLFSETLALEWQQICELVKSSGPAYSENGEIIANPIKNTIAQMTNLQCQEIIERITKLRDKVAEEF